MGRRRMFDHDKARAMRAKGTSYKQLAAHFGVTSQSVACACDPERRQRSRESSGRHRRSGVCRRCGGQRVRYGTTHTGYANDTGLCRPCYIEFRGWAAEQTCASARDGELLCSWCDSWLPDDRFYRHRKSAHGRRGRASHCKQCDNACP